MRSRMVEKACAIAAAFLAGAAQAAAQAPIEKTIYSFGGAIGDGAVPTTGVVIGPQGALYGLTGTGGVNTNGIAYALTRTGGGPWTETVLADITGGNAGAPYPSALAARRRAAGKGRV